MLMKIISFYEKTKFRWPHFDENEARIGLDTSPGMDRGVYQYARDVTDPYEIYLAWLTERSNKDIRERRINYYSVNIALLKEAENENKNYGYIEAFLAAGADPDAVYADGESIIEKAIKQRDMRLVEILIRRGVDVNSRGENNRTPLMIAANHLEFEIAKLLLTNGARKDLLDDDLRTAYDIAVLSLLASWRNPGEAEIFL